MKTRNLLWVFLSIGRDASAQQDWSVVASQLVEDECLPTPRPEFIDPLRRMVVSGLEAQEELHLQGPQLSFARFMVGLQEILGMHAMSAYECPIIMMTTIRRVADAALVLGQKKRARVLLQIGNMFKLAAMSRWYQVVSSPEARENMPLHRQKRFHPRMQMDYQLGLMLLAQQLLEPPLPFQKWPVSKPKPKIDVLSICVYSPDNTSNTVLESPLPNMAPENHRMYVLQTGLNGYFLHEKLIAENREAHYSKFLAVYDHMQRNPDVEWVLFQDCDAFFTNFQVTVHDLIETYTKPEINFIVAEDTGGINTGVFLVRNTPWSFYYLQQVTMSMFTTAWDQSMFFAAAVNETLWNDIMDKDFELTPEIRFIHQSHLNAFVPPASKDWQAYEWRQGDFARHFAGCPWQEKQCLDMMYDTLNFGRSQYDQELFQKHFPQGPAPPVTYTTGQNR